MSTTKIDQIINELSSLTVIEAAELSKKLEEHWGVSAAAPVAVASAPTAGGAGAVEEKTDFDVILTAIGDRKIEVIKVVREITGLGLKEAKELVEQAGPETAIKKSIPKADAEKIKAQLDAAGAKIDIK